jgi:hypothetical protein
VARIKQKRIQQKQQRQTSTKERNYHMNKPLGIALLALGIVLIIFGMNAADSVGSDFSRFFAGTPTNKSMWLLSGGVASLIVGGVMSMRPAR